MISKNLTAASSKPLILGILKQGKCYGYLILKKIKEISGGEIEWSDGMLYPVLQRMQKEGTIQSRWIVDDSSNVRPRKYYEITELGKKELLEERKQWMKVHSVLGLLWDVEPST